MDKKLAKQYVKLVGPLEHSKDKRANKLASESENDLRKLNKKIQKKRQRLRGWD